MPQTKKQQKRRKAKKYAKRTGQKIEFMAERR